MKKRKRKSYKGLKLINIAGPESGVTLLLKRSDNLVKIDANDTHGIFALGVEKAGIERVIHIAGFRSLRLRDTLLAEIRLARAAGEKTFQVPYADETCPCCGEQTAHLYPTRDTIIYESRT